MINKNKAAKTSCQLVIYYPFGMLMPGRHYNADKYRFGFNGKEHDTEWKGTSGAIYDYGFRIYDAKIAKFLSVDPLTNSYPAWTPYAYAMNIPIACIDLDGLEALFSIDLKLLKKRIKVDNSKDVVTIVHEYSKSKIAKTHLSKDGLTQTQAEKLKSGGFWDKVGGALQYPGAAYYNNSLSKLYNITKKSNTGFTGGTLTWSFALQMEGNIKNQTERTVHAKKWRYSNTFLHFFGQTLGSAIFGEGAAKYSADIHERGWDGVYTGKGDDSKIVDAYVDLVNNEWGRKFGRELAEKYGIDESTVWTEELTGKFLNDVQDYFTKTFPALEFNDVSKKYIKAFTKEINKQLGHKSGSKSKDKQGG